MHLVDVVPEVFEVFYHTLFIHLSKIVDSRVNETNAHDNVKENQHKFSMDGTLSFFNSFQLHKIGNISVENDHIANMQRQPNVVKITGTLIPSEFYKVFYNFARQNLNFLCFS